MADQSSVYIYRWDYYSYSRKDNKFPNADNSLFSIEIVNP